MALSNVSVPFSWLLRLRWATCACLGALLVTEKLITLGIDPRWTALALLVSAGSNLALHLRWGARACDWTSSGLPPVNIAGSALLLDSALLTLVLATGGGAANPFTILYIVPIVIAALLLDARWTRILTLASAVGFAALFFCGVDPHAHCAPSTQSTQPSYDGHLKGMWLAFAITAAIVAWVVRRLSLTLAEQRSQLAELRERALKSSHLAALTTLAGGAAHELRTPLGTIAVAAHELRRKLDQKRLDLEQDADLIAAEVERCQEILFAMGPELAARPNEPVCIDANELARRMREQGTRRAAGVELSVHLSNTQLLVDCDPKQLENALDQLLQNACDAVPPNVGKVSLSVASDGSRRDRVTFTVEDNGPGMSQETLNQARTPFFTTKAPGSGLGLGLLLVDAFCLSADGDFELQSRPGHGTRAVICLPRASTSPQRSLVTALQEQPA
ncbi:MAG TPA: ATP-binding protein [Polyangiaceae bacterium]|nr:ATP-binding protein [Polyangiaceae bacterium]